MSWSEQRLARSLLTADEVRRLGHDEAIILVSNQRPIWTERWWWDREARQAPSYPLGPAKAAALAPPADPPPRNGPTSAPSATPRKPTLRDQADKLKRLDDDEIEDLPDDLGRDRR